MEKEKKPNKKLIVTIIIVGIIAILLLLLIAIYFLVGKDLITKKKIADEKLEENKKIEEQISSVVKNFESIEGETIEAEKVAEMGAEAESLIKLGDQVIDPLIKELSSSDLEVRWLSVYVLARLGHETGAEKQDKIVQAFKEFVNKEENIALKQQAAAPLVGLGDKSGIPVLIECISDGDAVILFSEPPEPLDNLCYRTLKYYTGQDLKENSAWQDWWQKNQDNLTWDKQNKKYILKNN